MNESNAKERCERRGESRSFCWWVTWKRLKRPRAIVASDVQDESEESEDDVIINLMYDGEVWKARYAIDKQEYPVEFDSLEPHTNQVPPLQRPIWTPRQTLSAAPEYI